MPAPSVDPPPQRPLGATDLLVLGAAIAATAGTALGNGPAAGAGHPIALLIAFGIGALLAVSAADLAVAYPRAGGLFHYARVLLPGRAGALVAVFAGFALLATLALFAAAHLRTAAAVTGIPDRIAIPVGCGLAFALSLASAKRFVAGVAVLLGVALGARLLIGGGAATRSLELQWSSEHGILEGGLALATWSFVGIELAATFARETRRRRIAVPLGTLLGLVVVLVVELAAHALPARSVSPQTHALTSIATALAFLTVASAVSTRVLARLARDGFVFGLFRDVTSTRPAAGLVVIAWVTLAATGLSSVDTWTAAYVWMLLLLATHALALVRRFADPWTPGAFASPAFLLAPVLGMATTLFVLDATFDGRHAEIGGRAAEMLVGVLAAAALSIVVRRVPEPISLPPAPAERPTG